MGEGAHVKAREVGNVKKADDDVAEMVAEMEVSNGGGWTGEMGQKGEDPVE